MKERNWKLFENDEEGLHVIEDEQSPSGFIVCEKINDIDTAKLIEAVPELLKGLKTLNQNAKTLNNLQHAGVKIDSALWSHLYQISAQVDALIEKIGA